jgi:hypothetical protein
MIHSSDILNLIDNNFVKNEKIFQLESNQIEIVNKICDLNIPYIAILEARGSGKTSATAYAILRLAKENEDIPIGIFAPKWAQANRVIIEAKKIAKLNPEFDYAIDWNNTISSKIVFKNGSYIQSLSANASTYSEGWHWACMVLDEAIRISDWVYKNVLLPQLGSYKIVKLIKIGVALYRNHFWNSCNIDKKFVVLKKDFRECPLLLKSGTIEIDGKLYSKYVLDRMPISIKKQLFPNHPELHYEGDMDEIDFRTQYMMEWCESVNTFLTLEEQKKLRENGKHNWLNRGIYGEEYYYGLDTASGSLIGNIDSDYTSISIWRKKGNIKEKVFGATWKGDFLKQKEEIYQLIHPTNGIFPCKFGLIEYSNIGISLVEEFKAMKFPVEGILFNMTEPNSRKNYKNAMFEYFKNELSNDRVFYPHKVDIQSQPNLQEGIIEWEHLIKDIGRSSGINAIIKADEGYHDDIPCSDVIGLWATDKCKDFIVSGYKMPIIIGPSARVIGVNIKQESRYLR